MRARALVVAAVVLAGAVSPDAHATTATKEHETSRARSVLLRPRDFPHDWTSTAPPPRTKADERVAHEMSTCVGGAPESHTIATARGRWFQLGRATVSSSAAVVRSAADYRKEVRAAMSAAVEPCLGDIIAARYEASGYSVSATRFERLRVNRRGSLTRAVRVVFTLTTADGDSDLYIDAVYFGKKRVEASLQFTNVGAPFDPLLQTALVNKAGRRIDKL